MSNLDTEEIRVQDARILLRTALREMRYGGSIPSLDIDTAQSEEEFLGAVTQWVISLNKLLSDVSDTTTKMAKELTELRSQRKAVRDFLGLSSTGEK